MKKFKYIVGVDEVGRGSLAGPLAVCAFCVPAKFLRKILPSKLKDSKAQTKQSREFWFDEFKKHEKAKNISYKITYVSNLVIDSKGLAFALRYAISKSLLSLKISPDQTLVLLDGGIKASQEFKNQKTIIKGDTKEPIIAAASIMAKVTRDRLMEKHAKTYPNYSFETNKGYGTKKHKKALANYGPTKIHRQSFLTKF